MNNLRTYYMLLKLLRYIKKDLLKRSLGSMSNKPVYLVQTGSIIGLEIACCFIKKIRYAIQEME